MFKFLTKFLVIGAAASSASAEMTKSELDIPGFPFEIVRSSGKTAMANWARLRAERPEVTPILVGSEEDLRRLAEPFDPAYPYGDAPEVALAKAQSLHHPQSLSDLRAEENDFLMESPKSSGNDALQMNDMDDAIMIGDWPKRPSPSKSPKQVSDVMTGQAVDPTYILLVPTSDSSEVPAYLKLGGWNAHPPAEYHVAAFRSWKERYGAIPVIVGVDTIEFIVENPPKDKDAAMALAHEQFAYCEDIVTQGVGTVSNLGAMLMNGQGWYCWWD